MQFLKNLAIDIVLRVFFLVIGIGLTVWLWQDSLRKTA